MLLIDGITKQDRRNRVRELADVDTMVLAYTDPSKPEYKTEEQYDTEAMNLDFLEQFPTYKDYVNNPLDRKIENADDIALSMMQETKSSRTTITVSNLLTSVLIRLGIGDDTNSNIAREQRELITEIISAKNDKLPEQNKVYIMKTVGGKIIK